MSNLWRVESVFGLFFRAVAMDCMWNDWIWAMSCSERRLSSRRRRSSGEGRL